VLACWPKGPKDSLEDALGIRADMMRVATDMPLQGVANTASNGHLCVKTVRFYMVRGNDETEVTLTPWKGMGHETPITTHRGETAEAGFRGGQPFLMRDQFA
jgi:hypothetical protein